MISIDVDTAVTVFVNAVALTDDTDFKTRETAVAYNAAGMDLVWNFTTSAGVITQTAVTPTTGGVYDWTHVGDAIYKIEIPASGGGSINNDAEGYGYFSGIATGVLPWTGPTYRFRAAALNDALCDGGDNLDVNLVQWLGTAPLALSSQRVQTSVAAMASGVITAAAIATDAITSAKIAAGALTAAKFASGAFDAVWTVTARVLTAATNITSTGGTTVPQTGDSFARIGAAGANLTDLGGMSTGMKAEVNAEADAANADYGANTVAPPSESTIRAEIDSNSTQLASIVNTQSTIMGRIGAFTGSGINTILGFFQGLMRSDASAPSDLGGTYAPSTDAAQALRDRGDASWATATGFSTHDAAGAADAVWDELLSGHTVSGSAGEALSAAGTAGDPWTTALPGAYGSGSAGHIIGNLNDPTVAQIADGVWDEAQSAHTTVGTFGEKLDEAISSRGTPAENADAVWDELQSGHTTVGTFGEKLDETISSRATAAQSADAVWDELQSSHTTVGTFGKYLDTEVSGVSAGGGGADIYQLVVSADLTGSTLNYLAHLEKNGQQVGTLSVPSAAIFDKEDAAVSFTTTPTVKNTNVIEGSGTFAPTDNLPYALEVTATYDGTVYVGRVYMGAKA